MKQAIVIFPHQLYQESEILNTDAPVYLVESFLFFKQYAFHKQKIAFHSASMHFYKDYLQTQKQKKVHYIKAITDIADIRLLPKYLKKQGITKIHYTDPTDFWLEKRLKKAALQAGIALVCYPSPLFLNNTAQIKAFFTPDKKQYNQSSFYIQERKKRKILVDTANKPLAGSWSFDKENRKKYPVKKTPPAIQYPDTDIYFEKAKAYVQTHFSHHLGELTNTPLYPTNFTSAKQWLDQFLEHRFNGFGTYEDAIVDKDFLLHHSLLSPLLNTGLLSPVYVLEKIVAYAENQNVAINNTEGLLRQIIGWREFIHGMYLTKSVDQRNANFWGFTKEIPASFYNGTTGILPVDNTIKKVLKTGYCHHIERLMILGNFMLLCEFNPNAVYKWFMELFIDAYDWVMVANIYGMSQFADGGLFATKPYISGSNYIIKMSNYKKGDWQNTWDGLFWRFMDQKRAFFLQNPRLAMLVRMYDKMPEQKKQTHLKNAAVFLENL